MEPVLWLPDFEKPFELNTDALDKAISEVLAQEGHLISFESGKLNASQPIHDRWKNDGCGALIIDLATLFCRLKVHYLGRQCGEQLL